jgi:hypothetical protein
VAVWSEARNIFSPSDIRIVGSNPTRDIDACTWSAALRPTDPPSKESYQLSIRFKVSDSEWEQARGPNGQRKNNNKNDILSPFVVFMYLGKKTVLI